MDLPKVINNNYCIGCGVCNVISDNVKIALNSFGQYQATIQNNISRELDEICPFTNTSKNEDELSNIFFDNLKLSEKNLGKYIDNYVGYVKDDNLRTTSSSGGILSWLLIKLLEKNIIDGVIHVGDETSESSVLMGYRISFTKEEILQNRKSRYYPIEMSKVLKQIKNDYPNKIFAIVGIPCFIKSVRLLQLKDHFFREHIKYTFGIVCGHLKSKFFAESYAMESGISPDNIQSIDFRYYQDTDVKASNYSVKIVPKKKDSIDSIIKNNNEFFASNWGHGMFKYNACEFCDDVIAETADIVFGDAWLPEYVNEPKGTNIITVRDEVLNQLLVNHNEELELINIDSKKVLQSQDAGIRHRTEGLQYRLSKNQFKWKPRKRLKPSKVHIDKERKRIYDIRTKISNNSNYHFSKLKKTDKFSTFKDKISPLLLEYNKAYNPIKKEDFNIILELKKIYWKLGDLINKK